MAAKDQVTIRFCRPLPLRVEGVITSWEIIAERHDKNGKRMDVLARYVQDGCTLTIASGRTRAIEAQFQWGFSAPRGSLLAKIFAKLVRAGSARQVAR